MSATLAEATEVTRIDSKTQAKVASQVEDYNACLHDAAIITEEEHAMTTWQTIKDHPKSIMWVVLFSLALIMEGYDTLLLGNFYAQPAFLQQFGTSEAGQLNIPAKWQNALSNGVQVGEIIGLCIVGWTSERFGYKKSMLVSLFFLTAFIFIPFFAESLPTLLVGYILQGIPWGVFQTLTTTYAADIAPLQLRGILTSYNNICWVIGQLIAQGVLRGTLGITGEWGWKIPYAVQWVWPLPIFIACIFAPESPWWLIRQGRKDEAATVLKRLGSRRGGMNDEKAQAKINEMTLTAELEKEIEAGATYIDCFRGLNLRRTEIVSMVYLVQSLGGGSLMGYSTYFFQQAGLGVTQSFNLSIGLFALGFVGTVSSWFLMQKFNRRAMFLFGQGCSVVLLLLIGILACVLTGATAGWAIGALLLCFTLNYDATVGPVVYSLVAELPSAQVRSKSVAIARALYCVGGIIVNVIQPRFLNNQSNIYIGAKCGFVWAVLAALFFTWTFFRCPDPTGRTQLEIDALFEARTPARKFRVTKLDLLGHEQGQHLAEAKKAGSNSSSEELEKSSVNGTSPSNLAY